MDKLSKLTKVNVILALLYLIVWVGVSGARNESTITLRDTEWQCTSEITKDHPECTNYSKIEAQN
jgi:hypothetical protein